MLETFTVTFCGNDTDEYGMPVPYHHYLIVANAAPALGEKASVASVMPLTESPKLVNDHFPILDGTPGKAAEEAIKALANLQGNKGLNKFENEMNV